MHYTAVTQLANKIKKLDIPNIIGLVREYYEVHFKQSSNIFRIIN